MVLHKCDNRPCCRPDHLFLGTAKDNTDDMISKGRHWFPVGTQLPHSKLTEAKVRKIRDFRELHYFTHGVLADMFGVSQSVVAEILNRKAWAHVK